ncbi:MAG: ABC transporter permease subunit [Desulfobacterales bacterium]|nr:ABC transporter permease subunit [Desulfobacterales bacterium]
MAGYIIKRICWAAISLVFVSFFSFVLITFIPSDPAEVVLRVNDVLFPSPEAIEEMRQELGLDRPFLTRYFDWLTKSLRFDFGVSFINNNRTVAGEILRTFPYTLKLAGFSLLFLFMIGLPLGILGAVFKDSWFDRGSRFLIFAGTAAPNYWLAYVLIWVFSLKFGIFPSMGVSSWQHYILPALALSTVYLVTYTRLIRNSMLENMKENYVLYAQARGISEFKVIMKHVLKNSLQSTMTALGISIVSILSGTFVIENIFSIPGLGRLILTSIFNRDYPVIQAFIWITGAFFVFANLAIDILQCVVDPRLKKGLVS